MQNLIKTNSRRMFIGKLAARTAASLTSLAAVSPLGATPEKGDADAESWFMKAKGTHRIVYDASEPHSGLPFIWSWVFYHTNNETGVADNDMTAMVVLRHNAIPFALEDKLWKKYNLGEVFKVTDTKTGSSAVRTPYYTPREGDFPMPVIQGIQKMQDRGAMFCVCNMALKVYSGVVVKATTSIPKQSMRTGKMECSKASKSFPPVCGPSVARRSMGLATVMQGARSSKPRIKSQA